jgi:hypothetical protein
MTEIEQIKQERDQAIAAALKLRDAVAEHIGGQTYPNEIALVVKEVEAIAPKSERLELWVLKYSTGTYIAHRSAESADMHRKPFTSDPPSVHHMREVRPVKWGRWEAVHSGERWWVAHSTGELIGAPESKLAADWISDAHNAAMERLERGEDE